ncbi:hypothetical protein [Streptomyces sp. KS 21]|uniref:hypothetical protein n=1 Tax=Streptomyces sp. KS 21 TaxID=2485150 RepID=UPI001062BC11|nr:hypothetical protein [Streptomyces sp. KS 21]
MCACGWRSAARYPLDWDTIGDQPLYEADVDLTGPLADWTAHLSVVRDAAVPLPEQLTALLIEMAEQLNATSADAPLAALRAVGVLERIAPGSGRRPPARCATTACPPMRWPRRSAPPAPRPWFCS